MALRRLGLGESGNMSIIMMGVMAALALIVGGVVDYASLGNQKRQLQAVADGAALAAAREMVITTPTKDRVQSIAETYVAANYKGENVRVTSHIDGRSITVSVTSDPKVYFPGPVGLNATTVATDATAEISGGGNVCMIGLSPTAPSTLLMSQSARLTAQDCAIYSNSRSASSLRVQNYARVTADLTCVAGGVAGTKSAVVAPAVEDCPPIADQMRDHPDPNLGLLECDHLATVVLPLTTVTLNPGVYCGGITVAGTANLKPGIYVMNNGPLLVAAGGKLIGENVGFYLTGVASIMDFTALTEISLTAPKTGPMAGILFFEDRDTLVAAPHHIRSKNARRLVGTMYFPNSKLLIDANNPVADQSEYTVIIAREFELKDGPELVLNTDYNASPIPLPDGVGNKSRPEIRLVE